VPKEPSEIQVAIIGGGFGGIGAAVRLLQAGVTDLLIFERAADVGGVWRDNTYPGCACDVPSPLYSFSFAQNSAWSHHFAPQPEIWAYLRRVVQDFGLTPHLRLSHEVREARWDAGRQRWRIETGVGSYDASALIVASGALSDPDLPDLPGLERFAGVSFHSARWDHAYELAGRRVAVVGTGASAIQIVPAIQPKVAQLKVFQRTPPWIVPRLDRPLSLAQRRLFARFPLLQRLRRAGIYVAREMAVFGFRHPWLMRHLIQQTAISFLRLSVPDPALRAKLTPRYAMGCKRILLSDDYLPAIQRPNVELITERIVEVSERGIITGDGAEHEVDAIIFGTGFKVTAQPIARQIRGREGQTLAEAWGASPQAHLGTTVVGFPNMFMLQGPNTGQGHTSVIYGIERQIEYIVRALDFMRARGVSAIEPRPEAQDAFVADVDRAMAGTVWTAGGCKSWYLDASGRNSTLWPGFTWQYAWRLRGFEPREYLLDAHTARA
jgi:cation diffusion facilitator CzcD-associated flavoprotein CzcO